MKIDRKGLKAQAKQAIRAAARIDFLRPEGGESPLQLQPFTRRAEKDMTR